MIKLKRPICPYPKGLRDGNYKHEKNKQALASSSNDKCMYCESKISHISYAQVEHIKPKAPGKYPELEFEWNNHGYSCQTCNTIKSDKYDDATPYIDPYSEIPSDYLFMSGAILFQRDGNERGQITIRDIDLNRPDLVLKREMRLKDVFSALNAAHKTKNQSLKLPAIAELGKEALPDKEYSLCVSSFLKSNEST